jgi:hypothetical protein
MSKFYELNIDQSANLSHTLILTNEDGTTANIVGNTFSANAKTSYVSPNVAFSMGITVNDAPNGNISLTMTASAANVLARSYVFDLKGVSGNVVTRFLSGTATVWPSVT